MESNNIYLNENDIIEKNIEDIYSEIIISLIKNNKLSDDMNANEIISSLDIENIDLTENMLEELKKELNTKKDYLQNYKIIDINDLSNNRKNYFLL